MIHWMLLHIANILYCAYYKRTGYSRNECLQSYVSSDTFTLPISINTSPKRSFWWNNYMHTENDAAHLIKSQMSSSCIHAWGMDVFIGSYLDTGSVCILLCTHTLHHDHTIVMYSVGSIPYKVAQRLWCSWQQRPISSMSANQLRHIFRCQQHELHEGPDSFQILGYTTDP